MAIKKMCCKLAPNMIQSTLSKKGGNIVSQATKPRKVLEKLEMEINLLEKSICSEDESELFKKLLQEGKALPDDIDFHEIESNYEYLEDDEETTIEFFRFKKADLNDVERLEYVALKLFRCLRNSTDSIIKFQKKQLESLESVVKMLKFFVILTVISLFLLFLSLFITLTSL